MRCDSHCDGETPSTIARKKNRGSGVSCNNHNAAGKGRLVRSLIALSLTVAACFAPAAYALDTGDIVVTSITGDVHVTVNGAERAVRQGGVLDTPASIHTGRDGTIELRQGTTTVSVGP